MQKEGKKEKKRKKERNEIRIHAISKQIGGEKKLFKFSKAEKRCETSLNIILPQQNTN